MKILCKLSFILFVLFQLVRTTGGAKLVSSGVPHSGGFDKNDTSLIKMTGYLASSIWQEVSSVVQNGWQKTVAFAKTLTNKTANNSSEKVIVKDEKSATGHNTNSSSVAVVDNNHSTARNPFTRKFIQQENLSYHHVPVVGAANSTSIAIPECKTFDCMVWKVSKVMGISVGGGFLASLAFPVAAYLLLNILGFTGYGTNNCI